MPPGSEGVGNSNPIRIYQQNFHIDVCPRGVYLVLMGMVLDGDKPLDEQMGCLRNLVGVMGFGDDTKPEGFDSAVVEFEAPEQEELKSEQEESKE